MGRVSDSTSSSQGGGNDGCFSNFCLGCAGFAGVGAVNVDAIRTLRGERHRNRDELLVFDRYCAVPSAMRTLISQLVKLLKTPHL